MIEAVVGWSAPVPGPTGEHIGGFGDTAEAVSEEITGGPVYLRGRDSLVSRARVPGAGEIRDERGSEVASDGVDGRRQTAHVDSEPGDEKLFDLELAER